MSEQFRELTCIVCPKGCPLKVVFGSAGEIKEVTGYTCKRGLKYAEDECTHPKRTVTSTVKTEDGGICAVKTTCAVPKELVFEVIKELNGAVVSKDSKIGDTVIKNVCKTEADVVITGAKNF